MNVNRWVVAISAIVFWGALGNRVWAYPVDGYSYSGIRRLEKIRRTVEEKIPGRQPVAGALRAMAEIRLNLDSPDGHTGRPDIPKADPAFQKEIDLLFKDRHGSYGLCVLDITPGRPRRYAERQARQRFSTGSVGKLAIAAGLFAELKRLYPDSVEKRRALLTSRLITADRWIHTDHHDLPIYNPDTGVYISRPAAEGDVFSLYEWADHMLSASANAAASIVWKELMLMRHFGNGYPPNPQQEQAFFTQSPKTLLREVAMSVVNDPLRAVGIEQAQWQLGSFFTHTGKKIVPGEASYAVPAALLKFLVAMDSGRLTDSWSSLELKRLMYLTAKRIRYASSPALDPAAVFFKSGSLYRCKPEPDFKCKKYHGNVDNYMNSVALVEHPAGRIYYVVLMSNVLRVNSAVEHQSLAAFIDKILSR